MHKPNILDTQFAKTFNIDRLAVDTTKYLQRNDGLVTYNDNSGPMTRDFESMISKIRPMTKSHMNTLFQTIVESGKLSSMLFIDPTVSSMEVPELLIMDDFVIDGKYVSPQPSESLRKAWVNVAPMVANVKNKRISSNSVTDIPKMISSVVRAFLSMSYNDSDEWLPPNISSFICEFYTMAMSQTIIRAYNLDHEQGQVVRVAFAAFMARMLGGRKDNDSYPNLLRKSKNIFRGIDSAESFDNLVDAMDKIRNKRDWTLDIVAEIIRELVPTRLKTLTSTDLYRLIAISTTDSASVTISLTYPPYFVHQILKAMDGVKHPVFSNILSRLPKGKVSSTMDKLVIDRKMLGIVDR